MCNIIRRKRDTMSCIPEFEELTATATRIGIRHFFFPTSHSATTIVPPIFHKPLWSKWISFSCSLDISTTGFVFSSRPLLQLICDSSYIRYVYSFIYFHYSSPHITRKRNCCYSDKQLVIC